MKQLRPRVTNMIQIVDVGDGLVILEDSSDYRDILKGDLHSSSIINLYKVGYDFTPIWDAEYRTYQSGIDYYFNFIHQDENGMLICAGAIGDTYTLDPKTGKILKSTYTK